MQSQTAILYDINSYFNENILTFSFDHSDTYWTGTENITNQGPDVVFSGSRLALNTAEQDIVRYVMGQYTGLTNLTIEG